ncbi:MAG: hypothetical protein CVU44_20120 [Chloroflexi bacterium HGW-Chloroflexi-6]|nr:MAG: hypothetical protein CVU44_20120 [Chloroflexi bacterium HGW-Chloroflexi-6]
MELVSSDLQEDYCRWLEKIGEDIYIGPKSVGIFDVLRAHYLIVDYFFNEYGEGVGGIGPKDLNLLHSTLSRQTSGYDNKVKWNDDFEICATLFWGLVKNHAFHDANKRTATLTLFAHLIKIKKYPSAKQKEYERLAIRVAANELDKYSDYKKYKGKPDGEVLFIAEFLRKNTRRMDKAEYIITYKQLDTILRRYSYGLSNPDRNQIDIIKLITERIGFFGRNTKIVEKRIGSIGFPGWTKQVGSASIKQVRRITKLSVDDGYDSDAFFHGADSLPSLISQFQGLLQSLANK